MLLNGNIDIEWQWAPHALEVAENVESTSNYIYLNLPVFGEETRLAKWVAVCTDPKKLLTGFLDGNGDLEGTEAEAKDDPQMLENELTDFIDGLIEDNEDTPKEILERHGLKAIVTSNI